MRNKRVILDVYEVKKPIYEGDVVKGIYNFIQNGRAIIQIRSDLDRKEKIKTLIHELMHFCLDYFDTNRDKNLKAKGTKISRDKQEDFSENSMNDVIKILEKLVGG